MDGITELAKLLKERENPSIMGIQIGKVVEGLPNIKISLGNKIVLDKDDLIISAHILKDYVRDFEVEKIEGDTDNMGIGDHGTHKHKITALKGSIKLVDGLKAGDEVIVIPAQNAQTFYVIDKVVRI